MASTRQSPLLQNDNLKIRVEHFYPFRFVPLAGGVLSAASLVVEAKDIKATLSRMNEGNSCEKSGQILEIAEEVGRLPDAALIAGECDRVFEEAAAGKSGR